MSGDKGEGTVNMTSQLRKEYSVLEDSYSVLMYYWPSTHTCTYSKYTHTFYVQQLRWLLTRKLLAYRKSTCINLSVACPYEMIVNSVFEHINATRKNTIGRQFIPIIYGPLGERILSNNQPPLPFL